MAQDSNKRKKVTTRRSKVSKVHTKSTPLASDEISINELFILGIVVTYFY
jgi:hypothetical protein